MEDLTKSQVVLLALFVSFVTSIATGIVTVTLMDQAPPGVTRTINRVVEKTVETVVPTETKETVVKEEVVVKEDDLIIEAIDQNLASVFQLQSRDVEGNFVPAGIGLVLSEKGLAVTDRAHIAGKLLFASYQGQRLPVTVLSLAGDAASGTTAADGKEVVEVSLPRFALVQIATSSITRALGGADTARGNGESEDASKGPDKPKIIFHPASLADSDAVQLGQTAIILDGEDGRSVDIGFVSQVITQDADASPRGIVSIKTNVSVGPGNSGGPLLTLGGRVAGITTTAPDPYTVIPANVIKHAAGSLYRAMSQEKDASGQTGLQKITDVISSFAGKINADDNAATSTGDREDVP